ncbi:MAG: amidase, partial [Burkholderiales bacterium]|nr:amidase [Burkholderiales bacterium]
LRERQFSPQELLAAILAESVRLNPHLNCIVQTLPEQALQQYLHFPAAAQHSPLAGLPIFIKDLLADISGVRTRNGCHLFDDYLPAIDAEIIHRYRQAGLVFAAKTTTPELGLLPVTESKVTGITRNPWDLARTCGGSSGGAAAAVAARIVPIAHGGDGGGSIRIPASNCGVFGFKPSRGSSPCGPHFSENWQGFVVQHVLTRSVRDSAAMLDIMLAGTDRADAYAVTPPQHSYLSQIEQPLPRLRVAYTDQAFCGGELAPACKEALLHTVKILADLGHHIEYAHPPLADPEELCRAMLVMVCGELASLVRNAQRLLGRKATFRDFEEGTWALACYGELLSAGEFAWMRDLALRQGRIMQQFHQRYDVLLTPVTNQLPALHGALLPTDFEQKLSRFMLGHLGWKWTLRSNSMIEESSRRVMHYLGWTMPFNMSGQPAMSVPLYWTTALDHNGPSLPIGSQFVAGMGRDAMLLRLAQELERVAPWAQRRPHL